MKSITFINSTLLLVLIVPIFGCNPGTNQARVKKNAFYVDADQQTYGTQDQPYEDPSKIGPKNNDEPDLLALAKAQKIAQSNLADRPNSSVAKSNFIVATDRLATASMSSQTLDRKIRYRQALRLYRDVLKVDPTNFEAKNNSKLIISIYKQLGKPIPVD